MSGLCGITSDVRLLNHFFNTVGGPKATWRLVDKEGKKTAE